MSNQTIDGGADRNPSPNDEALEPIKEALKLVPEGEELERIRKETVLDMRFRAAPNWHHWSQMRRLRLWEAVALSCRIDPRRIDYRPGNENAPLRALGVPGEYMRRLQIAVGQLAVEGGLEALSLNNARPESSDVSISAFVEWARAQGWEIPPAMGEARAEERDEVQSDTPKVKPVSSRDIKHRFLVDRDGNKSDALWTKWMRNARRNGLGDCRMLPGRGQKPSFFFPDRVAVWLVDKGLMTAGRAAQILKSKFPDCAETADLLAAKSE
jgi:hypothetical protein